MQIMRKKNIFMMVASLMNALTYHHQTWSTYGMGEQFQYVTLTNKQVMDLGHQVKK